MELRLRVEKISPRAGIELGPLDQNDIAYHTELPGIPLILNTK